MPPAIIYIYQPILPTTPCSDAKAVNIVRGIQKLVLANTSNLPLKQMTVT